MERLLNNDEILTALGDLYENEIKKEFDANLVLIENIFEEILDNKKGNYDLVFSNSVHEGNYFKFSNRVKKERSIKEKLIRNSELLLLKEQLDLNTSDSIERNKENLRNYLKSNKDIIGVKVIGELIEDSFKIFNLINENIEEFKNKEIIFFGMDKQPEEMKNGLPIFKVNAKFKNEFYFELQIKSQLQSAWGDMEHQQFYKNYNYTPVKNSTQIMMNRVGKLIEEVDHLLYNVRTAGENYEKTKEISNFTKKLQDNYSEKISFIIHISPEANLIKLSNFLFNIERFIKPQEEDGSVMVDRIFHVNDQECVDKVLSNFCTQKKSSFDLQILEIILLIWSKSLGKYNDDFESYVHSLEFFFEKYKEYVIETFNIDEDEKEKILFYVNEILKVTSNQKLFYEPHLFSDLIQYHKLSYDIYYEKLLEKEDMQETYISKEVFQYITLITGIYFIEGDFINSVRKNKDVDEEYGFIIEHYKYMESTISSMKDSNEKLYNKYKEFNEINKIIINYLGGEGAVS